MAIFAANLPLFLRMLLFTNILREAPTAEWVTWLLLGCLFALVGSFRLLYQHPNVWQYLRTPMVPSANNLGFYIIVSVICNTLLAALLSGYVSLLPDFIDNLRIAGIGLNRYGYTWWVLGLTDLLRIMLTFLFFTATDTGSRWVHFYYMMGKYLAVYSVLLVGFCCARYFYPVDIYLFGQALFIFLAGCFFIKIVLALLHRPQVLPGRWYYNILYICALQFAPVLLVAQLLFIIP